MAAKVPAKEDRERTLDDALHRVVSNFENVHDLSKQQSAAVKTFISGTESGIVVGGFGAIFSLYPKFSQQFLSKNNFQNYYIKYYYNGIV